MSEVGLTNQQANRLREDIKRAADIHRIIDLTIGQNPLNIDLLKLELKLARAEYDAIGNDLDGMLLGNGKH